MKVSSLLLCAIFFSLVACNGNERTNAQSTELQAGTLPADSNNPKSTKTPPAASANDYHELAMVQAIMANNADSVLNEVRYISSDFDPSSYCKCEANGLIPLASIYQAKNEIFYFLSSIPNALRGEKLGSRDHKIFHSFLSWVVLDKRYDLLEYFYRHTDLRETVALHSTSTEDHPFKGATALWLASWMGDQKAFDLIMNLRPAFTIYSGNYSYPFMEKPIPVGILEIALLQGHKEFAKSILQKSISEYEKAEAFSAGLYAAIFLEDTDLIEALTHAGAKLDQPITNRQFIVTPFQVALAKKDRSLIERYLKMMTNGDPKEMALSAGLLQAAFAQDQELMNLLLDLGADPSNKQSIYRMPGDKEYSISPLQYVVSQGMQEFVDLFIARSENINAPTGSCGYTALHFAVLMNRLEITQKLLKAHANPNLQVWCSRSERSQFYQAAPIAFAIEQKNMEMAKLLLSSGAQANSPVIFEGMHRDSTLLSYVTDKEDWQSFSLLASYKANPNLVDSFGISTLQLLLKKPLDIFAAFAKVLFSNGADPNLKTQDGYTALHLAFFAPEQEVSAKVKILVDNGAFVNTRSFTGSTPLMYAAGLTGPGYPEAVQYLLAKGADITFTNSRKQTAYSIAKERGYKEIMNLLCGVQGGQGCSSTNMLPLELENPRSFHLIWK